MSGNCFDAFEANTPGFTARAGQRLMAEAVMATVARQGITVCEAPTGTGKTLGALVPALTAGRKEGKPVIMVTGTVLLQQQIMRKEVALLKAAGLCNSARLVVGAGRYLCPVAAHSNLNQLSIADLSVAKQMLRQLEQAEWTGLTDDWRGEPITDKGWSKVCYESATCTKHACPKADRCPMLKAREDNESADLIVTNYAMLLCHLLNRTTLLPDLNKAIVILDEGHLLPEMAYNHSRSKLNLGDLASHLERAAGDETGPEAIQSQLSAAAASLADLEMLMRDWVADLQVEGAAILDGDRTQYLAGRLTGLAEITTSIQSQVDDALEACRVAIASGAKEDEGHGRMLARLGQALTRISDFASSWCDENNVLHALEDTTYGLVLACAPLTPSAFLIERVWSKLGPTIVMSATFRALNQFDLYLSSTGLDTLAQVQTMTVPSCFDYQAQGRLFVAIDSTNPQHDEARHSADLVMITVEGAKRHRAILILLNSRRQLKQVVSLLAETPLAGAVLAQDSMGREQLLERHIERISRGETSIIVGMASFAVGVSLERELLTMLVIGRIPFPDLSCPYLKARLDAMESEGKNSFSAFMLPMASTSLNQMAGRLLRTEECRGEIVLADPRFTAKRYGASLISGLPPFTRARLSVATLRQRQTAEALRNG